MLLEATVRDLRFGARVLGRNRAFTASAVLTLALATGPALAVFGVVNAVLLRPLPFEDPERVTVVWARTGDRPGSDLWLSPAEFVALRERTTRFEGFVALTDAVPLPVGFALTGRGEPTEVEGVGVSASLFPLLGVRPQLGRGFLPEEDAPGAPNVVVVSHGFWVDRLGGDPGIVGQPLTLGGRACTVVGVMPEGFRILPPSSVFPSRVDVWAPFESVMPEGWREGRVRHLHVLARLGPGVTLEQAEAELGAVARGLAGEHPDAYADGRLELTAVPLLDYVTRDVRGHLLVLMAVMGLVLVAACTNVASLLLARAPGREREMAVRAALGASRARAVRQLLAESALLAAAGGLAGLLLAWCGIRLLSTFGPEGVPRLEEARVDPTVLGFSLLLVVATALAFGVVPALKGARSDVAVALGARGASFAGRRTLGAFAVVEVAVALVVLVATGLVLRSYVLVSGVDPGFDPSRVAVVRLDLSSARDGALEETVERVAALPGVGAVGAVSQLPLSGAMTGSAFVPEDGPLAGERVDADLRRATPGYFEAMGISVLRGRDFAPRDGPDAPAVAVVDEAMAERLWPGADPVGRRFRWIRSDVPLEVVGVVRSVRHRDMSVPARETVYFPFRQRPSAAMTVAVRAEGEPSAVAPSLRAALRALDPDRPVPDVATLDDLVWRSLGRPRFTAGLLGVLAAVALALAAVGTYGVIATTVAHREKEMGVRMALGAAPAAVVRLVVGEGMRLAAVGAAVGLVGALALGRTVEGVLFEVAPTDPATYAAVVLLLLGVALAACYLPARRAASVDPAVSLRAE